MDEVELAELYPESKFIKLTRGQWAIVDPVDFLAMSVISWNAHKCKRPGVYYAMGHTRGNYNARIHVQMHRLIASAPSGVSVDHINHNTLDNRRSNLRLCSLRDNLRNSVTRRGKRSSVFKGIFPTKNGRWLASIRGVVVGRFDTEGEAARAYDAAAIVEFGEFAHLNF